MSLADQFDSTPASGSSSTSPAPTGATSYAPIIQAAGQRWNVDPRLLSAMLQTESSGQPGAVSNKGATGLMQIEPSNYKALGITNPKDPTQNIMGGAQLMSQLLDRYGDVPTALLHYVGGDDRSNWGPQTAAYPLKVLNNYQQMGQSAPSGAAPQGNAQAPAAPSTAAPASSALADQFDSTPTQQPAPQAPAQQPAQQTPQGNAPGGVASFAAGLGHGVGSTVLGAQQLLGHGAQAVGLDTVGNWLVNDANQGIRNLNTQYAPYSQAHPIAAGAGNIGGSIAATAPLAALAPEAAGLGGTAAIGAGLGAAGGALEPVNPDSTDFAGDKLRQVGVGAATGGVMAPLASLAGRVISPNVSTDVRTMLDRGVTPTIGQTLGGAWARLEAKATSLPVVGDMIVGAQQRAVNQFNRATYADALAPIGGHVPDTVATGSDAVGYVNRQIGQVYQSLEPRAQFTADANFDTDLAHIRADLSQNAPGALPQFDNIVQHQITGKLQGGVPNTPGSIPIGGQMNGAQWGDTRSTIAGIARNRTIGNSTPDDRTLASALGDLNDAVNQAVGRSSPPDVLPTLQNANAAWSRYKQIEGAAGSTGASNNGNIFTPAQYNSAIRKGSTNAQKAQNSGQNADFGSAAQNVLGSKYPDSGTAGRGILGLLTTGGLGYGLATQPLSALTTLGGIGAASLPYTGLGQRAAAAALTTRPQFAQPVGQAVSRLGQLVIPGAISTLLPGR